jgi:hypothetical protein
VEKFTLKKSLPACRVDKRLLAQIETFFLTQVARGFKKEIESMMYVLEVKNPAELRKFSVTLLTRDGILDLSSMAEFKGEALDPSIREAVVSLKLGRPELIDITVIFSRQGFPVMELTTFSKAVHQAGDQIHQKLISIMGNWSNRNGIVHHRLFRGVLSLAIPGGVVGYGYLRQLDLSGLLFAQGWLLILAALLSLVLTRIFPRTSFKTRRHINFRMLGALALFSTTLAAIAGYVTLLLFELGHLSR